MKKLDKQTKLIALIAIVLVAVILTIVITTNVINNNVGSEGYSATTANANSNLVASYIKEGITIGGITGTLKSLNTFDATATAEDIIWGKTGYVKGEKITGTKVVTVAQAKEAQKVFETNTTLLDDYGNSVKVPAGFKIAEDSATAATGGVVIEDVTAGGENSTTIGSQFVWIPVGDVKTDENGNTTSIILGRYAFDNGGNTTAVPRSFTEDTSQNHNSNYKNLIAKDINDFIAKANASHGYYLGRYEAGDAYATSSARTEDTSDSNPIVCKAGVYPYNYITQSQASNLCRKMYISNYFESDLINSYAWDTATLFIQEFSGDVNYSKQIGRNTAKTIQKCGVSILDYNLDEGDKAEDVRCNIYDMAGNTREWSTETYPDVDYPCVLRGGYYDGTVGYTSYRSGNDNTDYTTYRSARPILYL